MPHATEPVPKNLSQSQDIHDVVEEKYVAKTGFLCQFNGYRTLRPGGSPRQPGYQPNIPAAPHQCRFHCQDASKALSLLVRTPLLQVKLTHFTWNAYYNAAPQEQAGHFLWIPTSGQSNTLPHFPQVLTLEFLEDAVSLFTSLNHTIVVFNALHAGASVNHIHLQAIHHPQRLPIEAAPILNYQTYGLLENYPAQAFVFSPTQVHQIFCWVDRLQQTQIPFNLAMLGTRIILIPRNPQHEIVAEFAGHGTAALGMCGRLTITNQKVYKAINEAVIHSAFQKMVLPAKTIIQTSSK